MSRYSLDYKILAERIKQARQERGYSQSKLAELVGVSTNTIGKLEINYTTVSLNTILNIANALEVDVNYFFSDTVMNTKKSTDLLIDSLLEDFTEKDKQLLIQLIKAITAHNKKQAITFTKRKPFPLPRKKQ
jgi:transcriptional regulator with XRE-family HTH domain